MPLVRFRAELPSAVDSQHVLPDLSHVSTMKGLYGAIRGYYKGILFVDVSINCRVFWVVLMTRALLFSGLRYFFWGGAMDLFVCTILPISACPGSVLDALTVPSGTSVYAGKVEQARILYASVQVVYVRAPDFWKLPYRGLGYFSSATILRLYRTGIINAWYGIFLQELLHRGEMGEGIMREVYGILFKELLYTGYMGPMSMRGLYFGYSSSL